MFIITKSSILLNDYIYARAIQIEIKKKNVTKMFILFTRSTFYETQKPLSLKCYF